MVQLKKLRQGWWAGAVLLSIFGAALAQTKSTGPVKRAKPPKFDASASKVFFADAREKLVGQPVFGPNTGTGPATSNPGNPATPGGTTVSPTSKAPDGMAWSKIIKRENLEDEVKRNITPLADDVKATGPFKSTLYKESRKRFANLAVAFAVIDQYDGEVRWKKDAAALSLAMFHAASGCKVGSDNSFKEAKDKAAVLAGLLRGDPINYPKSDEEFNWTKIVDLPPVMLRMQAAGEVKLKQLTASEGDFKGNLAEVGHEAQVLAVLSTIIKEKEYGYGDDTFNKYADEVRAACIKIAEAVELKSYDTAREEVGKIQNACSTCHSDYR